MEPTPNASETPQNIETEAVASTSHHPISLLLIFGSLFIFVITAAVLFYNNKRTSDASYKNPDTYMKKTQENKNVSGDKSLVTATPTPVNEEESAVNNIVIDDGEADMMNLENSASGL